jgi:pentatricopeptide repeat protein
MAKNHRTYGALLNCYCSSKKQEKATYLYHNKMDEFGINQQSDVPLHEVRPASKETYGP